MSSIATRAPSAASRRAVASPMPSAAPVTRARLPADRSLIRAVVPHAGARLVSVVKSRALRRELGFVGAVALAVGVMAPTLAMSITGVAAAGQLGARRPGRLRARGGRGRARRVGVHPAVLALRARRVRLRVRRSCAGAPRRLPHGLGAARHLHRLPARVAAGDRHLRAGADQERGDRRCAAVAADLAGRLGRGLGARGARDQGDDGLAARLRGDLGAAHPRACRRDLRQAHRGQRARAGRRCPSTCSRSPTGRRSAPSRWR